MEYVSRLTASGALERGNHRGVFQLCKNDAVTFQVPVSIAAVAVGEHEFTRPVNCSDAFWSFRFVFTECGSVKISDSTRIVVSPISEKLTLQTVLPRCLPPVDEWIGNLSGFSGFHFPPMQRPGESQSCYSISDHFDVDPELFPNFQSKEERMLKFHQVISELSDKKFLVTDIVLNHVASSSPLLDAHLEIGYTEISSPHLQAAFELEQKLIQFERRFLGSEISSESDLHACMERVRLEIVENFEIENFFQIDFKRSIDLFNARWANGDRVNAAATEGLFEQAVVQCGRSRNGFIVDGRERYGTFREFISDLHATQSRLDKEAEYTKHEIISSLTGYFRYHCLAMRERRLHFPRYFTVRNGGRYFANNGWVMGWPAEKDFAAPGTFVYLRRQLVCWGDCVKLNFGRNEADNKFLWEYMTKYCVEQVTHFQGIRLDNAHSTSPEFLAHVMREMRRVNKDLFVMAELFSGDERADELFVEKLGINALVREIVQVNSVHDVVFNLWRLGCRDAGSLGSNKIDGLPHPTLYPTPPRAVFYDCTHDNPTPNEKFGRPGDALGLAAVAAAAPCIAGTVRGFDDLLPVNVHVVPDGRKYLSDYAPIPDEVAFIWPGDMHAAKVEVFGAWDSWREPLALTKDTKRQGWWARRPPAARGCDYKYLVDGRWRVNPMEPAILAGGSLNNASFDRLEHAVLTFKDVRKKLSEISELSNFSECYFEALPRHGSVFIKRMNPETFESIVFLIRFAFAPTETNEPVQLVLEGEIDEVLLDCSLRVFENEPLITGGLADSLLQGFAHAIVHNMSVYISAADARKVSCCLPPSSVLVFRTKPLTFSVPEIPSEAVSELSLGQLNTLLFQCGSEERARTCGAEGTYHVPHYGDLVYAGVQGAVSVFDHIREDPGHLGHPLCENVRAGDWLVEYHVRRMRESPGFGPLASWLQGVQAEVLGRTSPNLKPCVVDDVLKKLHTALVSKVSSLVGKSSGDSELLRSLLLASVQFVDERTSMSAGLPHFSAGYLRSWGRDTFISFKGLLLIPKRFGEAKAVLNQFASLERFGLIPNLSDAPSFANPRYNCRDAAWWFARAWVDFEKISGSCLPDVEAVVLRILKRHWQGISFREPRAGKEIDAHMRDEGFEVEVFVDKTTGLVHGGNPWNCGTWMDKMGSSGLAGNEGVPATSRDGAAVEINATALYVLEYVASKGTMLREWRDLLMRNFDDAFWSDTLGIYKDVVGPRDQIQEDKLRPNAALSLAIVPKEFVNKERAKRHLEKTIALLMDGPLGSKTLNREDPDYRGFYENGDSGDFATACGFNYHNGPEWLWPVGLIYSACLRFDVLSKEDVMQRLQPHALFLLRDDWRSLPELTNAQGAHCAGSCAAQAWSVATLIELLSNL